MFTAANSASRANSKYKPAHIVNAMGGAAKAQAINTMNRVVTAPMPECKCIMKGNTFKEDIKKWDIAERAVRDAIGNVHYAVAHDPLAELAARMKLADLWTQLLLERKNVEWIENDLPNLRALAERRLDSQSMGAICRLIQRIAYIEEFIKATQGFIDDNTSRIELMNRRYVGSGCRPSVI